MGRRIHRKLALGGKTWPWVDDDTCPGFPGHFCSLVPGTTIHDHDFIGNGPDTFQRASQNVRGILGDIDYRQGTVLQDASPRWAAARGRPAIRAIVMASAYPQFIELKSPPTT